MNKITQAYREGMEEFLKHPSVKEADRAIVLEALRFGTKGYEGPLITEALATFARKLILAAKESMPEVDHNAKGTYEESDELAWNSEVRDALALLDEFLEAIK